MHSLATLSDEALSCILDYEPTCVVSLVLCGNSSFTARVKRCCSAFATPSGLPLAYKLPRLLFELPNLNSIDFSALKLDQPMSDFYNQVRRLPRTLKKLRFCIPKNLVQLLKLKDTPKSSAPQEDSASSSIISSIGGFWNVGASFPELEEFVLESYETPWAVKSPFFTIFPPNLRVLELRSVRLVDCDFTGLPRGVTSLRLLCILTTAEHTASLPPGLTRVSGVQFKTLQAMTSVPASLEGDFFLENGHDFLPLIPSPPPPNLRQLRSNSGCYQSTWPTKMPKTLTDISVGQSMTWPSHVGQLPPSVTRISYLPIPYFGANLNPDKDLVNFWPPHLRILRMCPALSEPYSMMPSKHLCAFPRTLEALYHLRVDDLSGTSSVFECASDLPPALTDLSIYATTRIESQEIVFEAKADETVATDESLDLKVSPLPSTLRTLTILGIDRNTANTVTSSEIKAFPPTLTSLEVPFIHVSLLPQLPRALTRLHIKILEGNIVENSFIGLPPHLTSLKMRTPLNSSIESSAFKHLPQSLYDLELSDIHHSVLEYLSVSIKRLIARIRAPKEGEESNAKSALNSSLPDRWIRWLAHQ